MATYPFRFNPHWRRRDTRSKTVLVLRGKLPKKYSFAQHATCHLRDQKTFSWCVRIQAPEVGSGLCKKLLQKKNHHMCKYTSITSLTHTHKHSKRPVSSNHRKNTRFLPRHPFRSKLQLTHLSPLSPSFSHHMDITSPIKVNNTYAPINSNSQFILHIQTTRFNCPDK